MRKIYLILNVIFIIVIVLLLRTYANEMRTLTSSSGKNPVKKTKVNKKAKIIRKEVVIPDENLVASLTSSNLFEVNRGEEIVAETAKKTPATRTNYSFRLMGVCHFGKMKGAIITDNSRRNAGKNYFTIGEDVGNGFKLYDVAEKSVVLKNGAKRITLELVKAEMSPQTPGRRPRAARGSQPPVLSRHPARTGRR